MSSLELLSPAVQTALATDLTIDITTTGRTSGAPRRIEIWFLNIDGVIYITGTPGPRDWFANLNANPSLVFHLKESITVDLAATAVIVEDRTERARVFASSGHALGLSGSRPTNMVRELSCGLAARERSEQDRLRQPGDRSASTAYAVSWYLNQGDSLDSLLDDAPMVRLRFD